MPTGLADLDDLTQGLLPGTLWVVKGNSGIGKTMLLAQLARVAGTAGASTRFISGREDRRLVISYWLAAEARVPLHNLLAVDDIGVLLDAPLHARIGALQGCSLRSGWAGARCLPRRAGFDERSVGGLEESETGTMRSEAPSWGAEKPTPSRMTHSTNRKEADMSEMIVDGGAVQVEELTSEQGRDMLEEAARSRFGTSWDEFYRAYRSGAFAGTDDACAAEELAFLAPFAR